MAHIHQKKLWIGPDFAPNDYERVGDKLCLKPERAAEIEDEMMHEDVTKYLAAREAKRAYRAQSRQAPATPAEIELIKKRIRESESRVRLEAMGIVLPPED